RNYGAFAPRPPDDFVSSGPQVRPPSSTRGVAGTRTGEVVDFGQHERRCREQWLFGRIPVGNAPMPRIRAVEEGVDDRRVDRDHSLPKPVSRRCRSTFAATSPGPSPTPMAVTTG